MNGISTAVPGSCTQVVSLGVMGTPRALFQLLLCCVALGSRWGWLNCACNLLCEEDLVLSLAASPAAPPILALLSIPTEFKMVSF